MHLDTAQQAVTVPFGDAPLVLMSPRRAPKGLEALT
jgi:hypothetical protein